MLSYAAPALAMLIAWWVSTGAILYLVGLPRRSHRGLLSGGTLLAGMAAWGLWASAQMPGPGGVFLAVGSALALWGWNELAFLLGYVTGPRREPCPPGLSGLARFRAASGAVMHHELALAGCALATVLLAWGEPNPFGWATFALLFAMRLSTKLNLFLGVPNTAAELLPARLAYLASYFRRGGISLLFPVTVTAATLLTAWLWREAALAADPSYATGLALLATLAALGLVEHWFLALPLPAAGLWRWSLRSREPAHQTAPATPRSISPPSLVA